MRFNKAGTYTVTIQCEMERQTNVQNNDFDVNK